MFELLDVAVTAIGAQDEYYSSGGGSARTIVIGIDGCRIHAFQAEQLLKFGLITLCDRVGWLRRT